MLVGAGHTVTASEDLGERHRILATPVCDSLVAGGGFEPPTFGL
jgi:hypothetical protein